MKLFGLFLAGYLLLLSAIPCCAIDNCPEEKTSQTASHEAGDEDCGTCSPFFNCEGCAAVSIAYEVPQFDFSFYKSAPLYASFYSQLLSDAHLEFWQPPKIS